MYILSLINKAQYYPLWPIVAPWLGSCRGNFYWGIESRTWQTLLKWSPGRQTCHGLPLQARLNSPMMWSWLIYTVLWESHSPCLLAAQRTTSKADVISTEPYSRQASQNDDWNCNAKPFKMHEHYGHFNNSYHCCTSRQVRTSFKRGRRILLTVAAFIWKS